MDVSLGFDARPAEEGFNRFAAAGRGAAQIAEQVEQAVARLNAALSRAGQVPTSLGSTGMASAVQGLSAALDQQAAAQARVSQATRDSVAASQQAQAAANAERAQHLAAAAAATAGAAAARQSRAETQAAAAQETLAAQQAQRARQQQAATAREQINAERQLQAQINAGLTALSRYGGEWRGFAQQTRDTIERARNMGVEIDRVNVLLQTQAQLSRAQALGVPAQVFSAAAVNARDLRLNIGGLAQQMAGLAGVGGNVTNTLLNISNAVRTIRQATAGGIIAGGSGLDQFSGAGEGAANLGALAIAGRTLVPLLGPLAVGIGAVGAAGAAAAPGLLRAAVEMERIEGRLRAATGSGEAAASELEFLRLESRRLGVDFQESAQGLARFAAATRGTVLAGQETREVFTGVATAASALRLQAAEVSGIFYALEQIVSKGTVTSEELKRQLGDRLPGAFRITADAMGVTTTQLTKMLEAGSLTAEDFLPKFRKALVDAYGTEAQQAAESLTGQTNRLNQSIFELKVAIGDTGVVDAFASAIGAVADQIDRIVNGPSPDARLDEIEGELARRQERIDRLRAAGAGGGILGPIAITQRGGLFGPSTDELEAERAQIQEERERIQRAAFDDDSASRDARARDQATKAAEKQAEAYAKVRDAIDREGKAQREYEQQVATIAAQEKAAGGATDETRELRRLAREELDRATGATKENNKALREAESEAKRSAKALADAQRAAADYTEELQQQVALANLDARSKVQVTTAVKAYDLAIAASLPNVEEYVKHQTALALAAYDGAEAMRKQEEEQRKLDRAREEANRELERRQEEAARIAQEPFLEAARNIQDALAGGIRSAMDQSGDEAQSAADTMVDVFKDAAAEILSLLVFRPQVIQQAGGIGNVLGNLLTGAPLPTGTPAAGAPSLGGAFQIPFGTGGVSIPLPAGAGAQSGGGGIGSVLGGGGGVGRALGGVVGSGAATQTALPGVAIRFLGSQVAAGNLSGGAFQAILGGTSPLSFLGGAIGSFGAQALGLGSGNQFLDGGLGALGGLGGGIAGAALMGATLGSFAGPIGAAIGAFAGVALGTLFKGLFEDDPDLPDLRLRTQATRGDDGSGLGFSRRTALETPFGFVGLDAAGSSGGDLDVTALAKLFKGIDETVAEALTPGQIAQAGAALQGDRALFVEDIGDPNSATFRAVLDRYNTVFLELFGGGISAADAGEEFGAPERLLRQIVDPSREGPGEISSPLAAIVAQVIEGNKIKEGDSEELVQGIVSFLEERQAALDLIDELLGRASPISDAKKAIDEINTAWDAFVEGAERYLFTEQQIADARAAQQAALAKVRSDFAEGIEDRILAIENPQELAFRELQRWRDETYQNARDLGLSAEELAQQLLRIEYLYGLERQQIVEQSAQGLTASFRQLVDGMFRDPGSSPLDPGIVLQNARAQAEQDYLRSLIGGPGSEATARLPQSLATFIDAAETVFARGPGFFQAFNQVTAWLEQVESTFGIDLDIPTGAGAGGGGGGQAASLAALDGGMATLNLETARGNQEHERLMRDLIARVDDLVAENAEMRRQLQALAGSTQALPVAAG